MRLAAENHGTTGCGFTNNSVDDKIIYEFYNSRNRGITYISLFGRHYSPTGAFSVHCTRFFDDNTSDTIDTIINVSNKSTQPDNFIRINIPTDYKGVSKVKIVIDVTQDILCTTTTINYGIYDIVHYYDLKIIDVQLDQNGNEISRIERSNTEYRNGNISVSIPPSSTYSEKRYEIYCSESQLSMPYYSKIIALNKDTVVYWYYKLRYSHRLYNKLIGKIKEWLRLE